MKNAQFYLLGKGRFERLSQVLFFLLFTALLFSGCSDQRKQIVTWTEYQPVYMTAQEFKTAVTMEAPRELKDPGKIYLYENLLFVNEINKGVHLFDNSDPANPIAVGFINIPGNKDIAVKDDLLYADSSTDLLVFDIQNLQNPELVTRIEDVFQFSAIRPPGFPYQPAESSKGIVVDWKPVKKHRVCEGDCYGGPWIYALDGATLSGTGAGSGIGGSTARFAITGNYLYAVDNKNLLTFNITSPDPSLVNVKKVGWAIETIFPYKQNLFIGSRSAMYIYDISNPASPGKLSIFPHSTACDPVVVEDDLAYVTLRNSPQCPQGLNRLEVIDVTNLQNPHRVAFYEMKNPHGLSIDDGNLFITEGNKGLKIFDADDPNNIKQLGHITDIKASDVIAYNNILIVTGESGIIQYNYSDINNLKLLSTIPIVKEE